MSAPHQRAPEPPEAGPAPQAPADPLRSQTVVVAVRSDMTADDLQEQISGQHGIPTVMHRSLVFEGRRLSGNQTTMAQYGIQADSTVHLVLRARRQYAADGHPEEQIAAEESESSQDEQDGSDEGASAEKKGTDA
eukprot:m51a1_g10706 putative ubiquitin (135) ;mRNA; r:171466-172042